jgi:hypothetical protein
MWSARRVKSWSKLALGLVLGLAIGGAMTAGVLIGERQDSAVGMPKWEDLHLKAMASHGADTFAIATGPVDDEVEGLFTLDFLTGDLQCFVPNPRTGGVGGWFKTNIANDMSIEKGKKPSYLIATGGFNFSMSTGNQRPANSLVYVADANTGEVACYTFPWNKSATSAGVAQATPMQLVGKWKARSVAIRK